MKQPTIDGLAASESLYGITQTESKIDNLSQMCNFPGLPSIIPGVPYPLTGREEQIIKYVWRWAQEMQRRGLL